VTLIRTCEVRASRRCGEVTGPFHACDWCCSQLTLWLTEIETNFARLNPQPLASLPGGSFGSAFGSKSPAQDHVIAMMDPRSSPAKRTGNEDDRENAPLSVPGVVGEWARFVWRQPGCEDPWPGTVGAGLEYLRAKVGWFAWQDCVAEFASEVRELHLQLVAHAEPKRKIGECPTVLGEALGVTVRCEAPLRASIDDDVICCWSCGSSWKRPWKELRKSAAGLTLMSYRDLAGWFKVPVGTLYRWRSEDDWTQQGGTERRPLWRVIDVMDSYDRRRTDKPTLEAS
jgi:hypothetical protein